MNQIIAVTAVGLMGIAVLIMLGGVVAVFALLVKQDIEIRRNRRERAAQAEAQRTGLPPALCVGVVRQ